MLIEMRAVTSMEKVFMDEAPRAQTVAPEGFQNEVVSYQLAYTMKEPLRQAYIHAEVDSPIAPYVQLRQVRHVPVGMACYAETDDNYLRKAPGLYPDRLCEIGAHTLRAYPNRWDSLWVEINPQGEVAPGAYPVTVKLTNDEGELAAVHTQLVTILPGMLPEQKLIHTRWLYCDCLAEYYHVPVFSEEHWRIVENYVSAAVKAGINMILMPVHTPPLDTRVGTERLTNQLVDVIVENGVYHFGMDKVRRWIDMCKRCGVKYYEVAHLFTQWGAQHAPKIMATVDGETRRIFGWDTDAAGQEYGDFLRAYVPALREVFRQEGIDEYAWWHISDEPSEQHLEHYLAAKQQVMGVLADARIMDALSSYEFYRRGVVDHPVVASNHMDPFLENEVPDLWTYYCCGQHVDVSNVFISMPGARSRILGMQLFRYDIEGFLQWGYNFYKSQYSDYPIDPFAVTDADGFVPAGDAFLVYPAADGTVEPSLRYAHIRESMQDLRAMNWLKELAGCDAAMELVKDITLTDYPRDAEGLLTLRRRANRMILEAQK